MLHIKLIDMIFKKNIHKLTQCKIYGKNVFSPTGTSAVVLSKCPLYLLFSGVHYSDEKRYNIYIPARVWSVFAK